MRLDERYIPYLQMARLYHLARLNDRWFRLDEPLDVAYHLGLPVDGHYVSGCLTDFHVWFQETFRECPEGADEETVRRFAPCLYHDVVGHPAFCRQVRQSYSHQMATVRG
ncbi:hypothetical protein Ahy_A03g012783 isoform A [Arachis hypogaea]|uniref:Aminotransferase-like plant mobile domain-containing protein n=1 Tax=Arachis hypogaea TaxID=3818 RepID=A0A445DUD6_ARAHY|nr:hypothetical protein Ahy_A03g012783 isoform A [Arachis hypogaea]